jgi:hypothetical protein
MHFFQQLRIASCVQTTFVFVFVYRQTQTEEEIQNFSNIFAHLARAASQGCQIILGTSNHKGKNIPK